MLFLSPLALALALVLALVLALAVPLEFALTSVLSVAVAVAVSPSSWLSALRSEAVIWAIGSDQISRSGAGLNIDQI